MGKTVKTEWISDKQGKRAVSAVLFLMPSDFTIHFFTIHRYFYSGSENNKLESGGNRGNMLTRRFAFGSPCRASAHKRELKQAVLVRLLNENRPPNLSAIVFSLRDSGCIFHLLGQ